MVTWVLSSSGLKMAPWSCPVEWSRPDAPSRSTMTSLTGSTTLNGILILRSLKYTQVWSLAALKRLDVHRKLKCLLSGMHRESGEWWLSHKLFLCSWKTVLHSCCAPWDNSEITVVPQPAINKVVTGFHHGNFPWILFFSEALWACRGV